MRIYKLSILILFLFCAFPGNCFAEIRGDFRFQKVYDNSYGVVTFNHEKHAVSAVKDCGYCHSALKVLNVLAVTGNDEFFADHVGGKRRFAQSRQVGLV